MTRKFVEILLLSLFLFAFLAVTAFGIDNRDQKRNLHIPDNLKYTMLKNKLAGDDDYYAKVYGAEGNVDEIGGSQHFNILSGEKILPSVAPGLEMGQTTYDYQHNSRMTRMVAWRGDHRIHFDWMKKNNQETGAGTYRVTAYQIWRTDNGVTANFGWSTSNFNGGKDVHVATERSGYVGVDVLPVSVGGNPEGRGVVYNHYDLTGGASGALNYLPTLWPDFAPASGNFSTYKQDVPDELLTGGYTGEYIWPSTSTQITSAGDTVIHITCRESDDAREFSEIRYFRREGPVAVASGVWTGFIVDTIATISYVCEHAPATAPNRDKMAIVWTGHWPATPGGAESTTPAALALLVEQNQNDIYCLISEDAGETWGSGSFEPTLADKHNITSVDSTVGGLVCLGDMSAIIDTQGRLHVVYAARPTGQPVLRLLIGSGLGSRLPARFCTGPMSLRA